MSERGWATWNTEAGRAPWTVGVEEELMLVDPANGTAANAIGEVLRELPAALRPWVSAETHPSVAEIKTRASPLVSDLADELAGRRLALADVARDRLGLATAAAGTHPLVDHSQVAVSAGARYMEIATTMGVLSRREPTMALHVHVAVPGPDAAVRALDGLRPDLPLLLALAGNSPFWRGADSGFASMRVPLFSMFPRTGIPGPFGTYGQYVGVVDAFVRSGAIPEPGFLWWDARLQPRLGTVEVRIMDAQSRVSDVAAVAALVQCLVRRAAERSHRHPTACPEILAENRFLAARDGMRALLIDAAGRRRPAHRALAELLDECRPVAQALGCATELGSVISLADDPGYVRQRRTAERAGPGAVTARLVSEFVEPDRTTEAA